MSLHEAVETVFHPCPQFHSVWMTSDARLSINHSCDSHVMRSHQPVPTGAPSAAKPPDLSLGKLAKVTRQPVSIDDGCYLRSLLINLPD